MIKEILKQNKKQILDEWILETYKTYPAETVKIFGKKSNQFQNPVGFAIADGLNQIFDSLINDDDLQSASLAVDKMVRIRSIQDFSASNAVSFIFKLRDITCKNFKSDITENNLTTELLEFDKKIDKLALLVFDSYMESREKLNALKINQAKIGSIKIADRVNKRLSEGAIKFDDEKNN